MSLQRRLILAIIVLLVCLLMANIVVNVYNSRLSFYQQLQVHAQDTATSLGFTISQAAAAKDAVQVSSMVDVIFDSGYYHRIAYRDLGGQDVVLRQAESVATDVPLWFIEAVSLPAASGDASVSSGWLQLGVLTVESHPYFVYQNLWRSFKEQLWLFLFTVVLTYGLLGLALKYLMRPLKRVEEQANAIAQRQFVIQEDIPSVPELRSIVVAMNHMVSKVKEMFSQQLTMNDRLLTQTRTDELTGLSNRRDFDDQVAAHLSPESGENSGLMVFVHIDGLEEINLEEGRDAGDAYIQAIANHVQAELNDYPNSLCSRHRGTDFAIYIPSVTVEESQLLPKQLNARLQTLEANGQPLGIYLGAVFAPQLQHFTDDASPMQPLSPQTLMVEADSALSLAVESGDSGVHYQTLNLNMRAHRLSTIKEWLEWLDAVLVEEALQFQYQPVWYILHGQRDLLFNELLAHIECDGEDYSAAYFVPMATRLQKIAQLDQLVIEKLLAQKDDLPEHICINLSVSAVEDKAFVAYLQQQLQRVPSLAKRLTFELPASSLRFSDVAVRAFAAVIHGLGASFSLHHFGRDTANFSYLQSLPIDYLKIDRSFTHNITTDKDAQFFVQSLVSIAKSCDVMILAEGVETEAQWQQLLDLGIQGGQGYWLGRPQPDPTIA